jgi:hypothetical protein
MAVKKIYSIQTSEGKRYGVGLFEGDTQLAGRYHGLYKTKKGAEKKLKSLF